MDFVEHFEAALGPMDRGWSKAQPGESPPFQVVRFLDAPMSGAVTFATLGLHRNPLATGGGKTIRLELIFTCYERFDDDQVASLLYAVGKQMLDEQKPLLRGAVLGPAGPLLPSSSLTALYVAIPVVFPDALRQWSGSHPPTVLAWLVPISAAEADFVRQDGWSAFENLLVSEDPDLFDLRRPGLVGVSTD